MHTLIIEKKLGSISDCPIGVFLNLFTQKVILAVDKQIHVVSGLSKFSKSFSEIVSKKRDSSSLLLINFAVFKTQ